MTRDKLGVEAVERVFEIRKNLATSIKLRIVAGIALLVFAAIGFLISAFVTLDLTWFLAATFMPLFCGLGMLGEARSLKQTAIRVEVGEERIRIETLQSTQELNWDRIGGLPLAYVRGSFVLFDTNRKPIARITSRIDGFRDLSKLIEARVKQANPIAFNTLRKREFRSLAMFLAIAGPAFVALGLAVAYATYDEQRCFRLIEEQGVQGFGQVEALPTAMAGPVKRVVYRVQSPNGKTAKCDMSVDPEYWKSLQIGSMIPIVYVPDVPRYSRLLNQEPRRYYSSPKDYLLAFGISLLGLFATFLARRLWRRQREELAVNEDT
ncbi:MAG: hypothetical protein K1Y02_25630 [Candidatus Hydrogenedentes bacterium]|nr:hypothetical protein [Candidatus Hydrogenedentota bacterium]